MQGCSGVVSLTGRFDSDPPTRLLDSGPAFGTLAPICVTGPRTDGATATLRW